MAESPNSPDDPPAALWLTEVWQQNRTRLERLFAGRIQPALQRRMGVDDLMQETYMACGRRLDFLQQGGDEQVYMKLRIVALQTLTDMERRHLAAGKRDAMKEADLGADDSGTMDAWAQFADSISSPRTHLERLERQAFARRVLTELPAADREILELRHFEELSNTECATVLGISQKTASIRYYRALKRFRDLLLNEDATI